MATIANISTGIVIIKDVNGTEYRIAPSGNVTISNDLLLPSNFQTGVDNNWITVTNYVSPIDGLAPLASPVFTGVPAGPTADPGTNTTQLATTAFVTAAIAAI